MDIFFISWYNNLTFTYNLRKIMKKYIKNNAMEYLELDEAETVIYDVEQGNIHYVDEISIIILQQLEKAMSFEELISALLEIFEGDENEIRSNTVEFIEALVEKKILLEVENDD